jgi:hypothetical protein
MQINAPCKNAMATVRIHATGKAFLAGQLKTAITT